MTVTVMKYSKLVRITVRVTGRAMQGNIQFEGGSIGPAAGRDNTFPCIVQPKRNAIKHILLNDSNL